MGHASSLWYGRNVLCHYFNFCVDGVQSGFIAFGFWLVDYLFNLNKVDNVQIH